LRTSHEQLPDRIAALLDERRKLEREIAHLRGLADDVAAQLGSGVVAIVSSNEGKGSLVVAVSLDRTARVSAVDRVRSGAAAMGGGGRPEIAQAGGPDGANAGAAVAAIAEAIRAAAA
jgi:alanyl-tRNA synthetase